MKSNVPAGFGDEQVKRQNQIISKVRDYLIRDSEMSEEMNTGKVEQFKKWKSERMGHPFGVLLAESAIDELEDKVASLTKDNQRLFDLSADMSQENQKLRDLMKRISDAAFCYSELHTSITPLINCAHEAKQLLSQLEAKQ